MNPGVLLRVGLSSNHFQTLPQWASKTHQPRWTVSIFVEKICLRLTTMAKKVRELYH